MRIVLPFKLVVLFFIIALTANSQNEIWYFGNKNGLDMTTDPPTARNGEMAYNAYESIASVSDGSGNILFYTDGTKVFNKNHTFMLNGDSLWGAQENNNLCWYNNGVTSGNISNICKEGSSPNGVMVAQVPNKPNQWYIFTINDLINPTRNGFRYSVVDMTLDGGNGAVIKSSKNSIVLNGTTTPTAEGMAVASKPCADSIWVVVHGGSGSNTFYAVPFDQNGPGAPVTSVIGPVLSGQGLRGSMDFNSDATQLAIAFKWPGGAHLFDFDQKTGIVSNWQNLGAPMSSGVYGVEFSPDDKQIYFSNQSDALYHYNIATKVTTTDAGVGVVGELELAPNGKIYYARNTNALGVISTPNATSLATSGYNNNGVALTATSRLGLPRVFVPAAAAGQNANIAQNDSTICDTSSAFSFSATPVGGTWSTNPPGLINSGTGLFDPTTALASVGNGGVVAIIYSFGCVTPDTIFDTIVNCCPAINVNDPVGNICLDDTLNLSSLVVTPNNGVWTIASGTGGSIVGNTRFNSAGATPGTFKLYYSHNPPQGPGCQQYDSITFVVNPKPTVSLSGGPICQGDSVQLDAGNAGSTYLWSPGGETGQTKYVKTAGPHKVVVTNATNCKDSATVTVTVNPNSNVSITPPTNLCDNMSASNLVASPTGGTWYINDVVNGAGQFDPKTLGANTHEIKYSYTDVNGCKDSDSVNVAVNAAPNVTITPPTNLCDNMSASNLVANPLGGTWYINDVVNGAGQFDPKVLGAGSHEIKYSYKDGSGCSDSDSVNVTVNAAPNVSITPPTNLCDNMAASTLSGTPTGGTWYINDVLNGAGQFDPKALGAAIHEIKYSYKDGSGCSDSDSVNVTVNAAPNVVITPFGPLCNNQDSVSMTVNPTGGNWYINGSAYGKDKFDPKTATVGNNNVAYVYTDGNSCTDSDTVVVVVNSAPNVSITPPTNLCDNMAASNLNGTPTGGTWYINDVVNGAGQFDPKALGASTHEIKYSYSDVNGCKDSDSVNVTVNAAPNLSITPFGPLCNNVDSVVMNVNQAGGSWLINNTANASGFFDPKKATVGNNDVVYVYTDGNNCTDSDTVVVVVNAAPAAVITSSNTVWCTNDSLTLSGATSTGTNALNYQWSQNGASGTQSTTKVAGTGPFQLLVTDQVNGCKDSTTQSFTAQLPQPNLGPDTAVCAGLQMTLDPNATNIATYLWSDNSNGSTLQITVGFGTYWVEVTDNQNCKNRDTIVISQATPFTIDLGKNDTICKGQSSSISVNVITGTLNGGNYVWVPNIGSSASVSANAQGTYTVYVTDNVNCKDTDSIYVHVHDLPKVDLGKDSSFCSLGKDQYKVVMKVNGDSTLKSNGTYSWIPVGSSTNEVVLTVAPVTVIGTFVDSNGCANTDTVELKEHCDPTVMHVPNVFVPGGSQNPFFNPIGVNDSNYVWYVNNVIFSDFVVYNRWGVRMYQSHDLLPKWDGFFENKPVSSGTYFFIWKYKDSSLTEYNLNGFIQLIQQNER